MPNHYWIDPRLKTLPRRPWRKIHLDFHNSQHMPAIGGAFDADEFGDRLLAGNVDSVVVFAKDMHGYFYYPSRYGPVHPALTFDLLGAQVEACRKRGIKVYAYYCTTWENYLAEQHPEWLVWKRDRTTYLPRFDETPRWTALCLVNEDFVQLMLDHAAEFVSRYEVDGAWFDMPTPIAGECFCPKCLAQLRARGLDPFDTAVQHAHKHELHLSFIQRMTALVRRIRPGCQVDYNGQGVYGLGRRIAHMDNVDIEALPTAFWGYYYFPTITRYARTFGVTTYGMTGRFHQSWADFGGLKLPAQLDVELASIVANGARCDIGDQLPPDGRLDAAVYHVIGQSYGRIKALEPYLEAAAPVTEAALIVNGLPLGEPATEANKGLVKLLMESHIQFDVTEPEVDFDRYRLLVLSDTLSVDDDLAGRLRRYLDAGGAIIASDQSALLAGRDTSWAEAYGLRYAGRSPYQPAYLVPNASFTGDIPPYPYALYNGSGQWRAELPAIPLATLGEPLFQRAPEHYTSHAQTPFDHLTDYAAIALSGRLALFAFPLGQSYYDQGYWVYRAAFQEALRRLLPRPLLETNAPLSSEVTVTHQDADESHGERWMAHVVNFSALRHTPKHPDFYDDPIALTDVHVRLNVPLAVKTARAVVAGVDLPVTPVDGGVCVTVPRVPVHEIICFEV